MKGIYGANVWIIEDDDGQRTVFDQLTKEWVPFTKLSINSIAPTHTLLVQKTGAGLLCPCQRFYQPLIRLVFHGFPNRLIWFGCNRNQPKISWPPHVHTMGADDQKSGSNGERLLRD